MPNIILAVSAGPSDYADKHCESLIYICKKSRFCHRDHQGREKRPASSAWRMHCLGPATKTQC